MSDKIVKSFEALKGHYIHVTNQAELLSTSVIDSSSTTQATQNKKKDASLTSSERIVFCNVIGDYLPLPSLRKLPEFPKLLSVSVELLLVACDDDNSDVRLVAGETINKLIKAFLDSHIGRILIEFYKEIKKNGQSRTLRAALQRFGDICHLIRPQKCRPYVINLLPSIIKVTKREDDAVQDVLGVFILKISPTLGYCMMEADVKVLLKSFLKNIKSVSAMTRRTAASSLNAICQYSRRPMLFYTYLVNILIGALVPLSKEHLVHTILGTLLTFRHLVPHFGGEDVTSDDVMKGSFGEGIAHAPNTSAGKDDNAPCDKQQLLKIYEIGMYFTKHSDHNVVNAALEVLHQILLCQPPALLATLLSADGIAPMVGNQQQESDDQMDTDADDDVSKGDPADSGLDDDLQSVSELSVSDTISGLSRRFGSSNEPDTASDSAIASVDSSVKDDDAAASDNDEDEAFALPRTYTNESMVHIEADKLDLPRTYTMQSQLSTISDVPEGDVDPEELDELMRLSSITSYDVNTAVELYLNIDAVACTGVPLLHCMRVMCSFLLQGVPGCLLPDAKTRVSVKSLALQCIGLAVKLYPEGLLAKVIPSQAAEGTDHSQQLIRDILLAASHPDPQIKGVTAGVVGNYINAAVLQAGNSYADWSLKKAELYSTDPLKMEEAVDAIIKVLGDESSIASKQAVVAAKKCLPALLSSSYFALGMKVLSSALNLKDDGYWLIKIELAELLSLLDYRLLALIDSKYPKLRENLGGKRIQDVVMHDILPSYVADSDARIRLAASHALVRIVSNITYLVDDNVSPSHAVLQCNEMAKEQSTDLASLEIVKQCMQKSDILGQNLSVVIRQLSKTLRSSTSKFEKHGCCQTMYFLSERYPVGIAPYAWELLPHSESSETSALHPRDRTTVISSRPLNVVRQLSFAPTSTMSVGILSTVLSMVTSSWMTLDLHAHQEGLKLCTNILCGSAQRYIRMAAASRGGMSADEKEQLSAVIKSQWQLFKGSSVALYASQLLQHIARILCILYHVIEQTSPVANASKIQLSFPGQGKDRRSSPIPGIATPTSLQSPGPTQQTPPSGPLSSPRKYLMQRALHKGTTTVSDGDPLSSEKQTAKGTDGLQASPSGDQKGSTENSANTAEKPDKLGSCHNNPHLLNLYEVLKGAFRNYQASPVAKKQDKFTEFLQGVLQCFSLVLELTTFTEVVTCVDELLEYLRAAVKVDSETTYIAMQQLLKSLFGTNAASQPELYALPLSTKHLLESHHSTVTKMDNSSSAVVIDSASSLYESYFVPAVEEFFSQTDARAGSSKMLTMAGKSPVSAFNIFKKLTKSASPMSRMPIKLIKEKQQVVPVQSYIRLFEPLVIHALKTYTTTSILSTQCQIFRVLSQLIRIRVNYSLLDADQVFIGFVLKQFEYLESGQIREPAQFVEEMFQFLVLLSYECYQSKASKAKAIVEMPKIIQLCDGIMACGQPASTHAIPSLKPIVHDLFIARNISRADVSHDLDTQREVVISMLLRLIQYPAVLELLGIVLRGYKQDEDRWRRLSRQIVDVLFPMLSQLQVQLRSKHDLQLLLDLLDSVAPLALRPADVILKHLTAVVQRHSSDDHIKWSACCYSLTKMVVVLNSEEIILSRLQQLHIYDPMMHITPASLALLADTDQNETAVPVLLNIKTEEDASAYFASFLFSVLRGTASRAAVMSCRCDVSGDSLDFLLRLMLDYLKLMLAMCASGRFKRVFTAARQWVAGQSNDPAHSAMFDAITRDFTSLRSRFPPVVIQWHFMLRCLGYDDHEWWKTMYLQQGSTDGLVTSDHVATQWNWTSDVFKNTSLLLFTELISTPKQADGKIDIALVCSLLKTSFLDLIDHANEAPVKEILSGICEDGAMSDVLVQFVAQLLLDKKSHLKALQLKRILGVLGSLGSRQSMAVLQLGIQFLPKLKYLSLAKSLELIVIRHMKLIFSTGEIGDAQVVIPLLVQFSQPSQHKSRFPALISEINSLVDGKDEGATQSAQIHVSHPLECRDTCINEYMLTKESYKTTIAKILHSPLSCGVPKDVSFVPELLAPLEASDTKEIIGNKEHFSVASFELCMKHAVSASSQRTSTYSEELQHSYEVAADNNQWKTQVKFIDVSIEVLMDKVKDSLHAVEAVSPLRTVHFKVQDPSLGTDSVHCLTYGATDTHDDLKSIVPVLRCLRCLLVPCCYRRHNWKRPMDFDDVVRLVAVTVLHCCRRTMTLSTPSSDAGVLRDAMECFGVLLHCSEAQSVLNSPPMALLMAQCVSAMYSFLLATLMKKDGELLFLSVSDCFRSCDVKRSDEFREFTVASEQISELVSCLRAELSLSSPSDLIPRYLVEPCRLIVTGLARLRWFNGYARVPPFVWKLGWRPIAEGAFESELPPLPVDILKEKEVLHEFICRINCLGWISRTQFEETWAALLGVISSPLMQEDGSFEEEIESVQSACLAIKSISSLLLDTTLAPFPGNPAVSLYSILHRQREYPFLGSRAGKKLASIRKLLEQHHRLHACATVGQSVQLASPDLLVPLMPSLLSPKFRKQQIYQGCLKESSLFVSNLEYWAKWPSYGIGQISSAAIRTRLVSSDVTEDTDSDDSDSLVIQVKETTPSRAKVVGFDIRSCLQFLLELFEQWLSPFVVPKSPLMLKLECVKSVCLLSDLVLEMTHFEWILSVLLEFQMSHPVEDDVMAVYIVPTVCKALGVIKLEGSVADRVCKMIELALKSPHVPLQISTLSGCLYVLESLVQSTNAILLPILAEFIGRQITTPTDNISVLGQRFALHVWSTAFYMIEIGASEIQDPVFIPKVVEVSISLLTLAQCEIPSIAAHTLLRGLERLVISFSLPRSDCERLAKMAAAILASGNSDLLVSALGLLCTTMYTGKEGEQVSGLVTDSVAMETLVADVRLVIMERLGILFNRIRRGLVSEAKLVARVLPRMLLDFLSVQEIMNKVISELLSSQQPHPETIAGILFEVCDNLQRQGQQELVRDWVLLSLGSFVQRSPVEMAVWSLSCCLTSASTNPWIQSLFAFVVKRKGCRDAIDRRLFCIAATDFYVNQSLEVDQQRSFLSTFESKANTSEAYAELVGCLHHLH